MDIIFVTNNKHKTEEIKDIFKKAKTKEKYNILTLADIGFNQEINEPYDSLEDNAKHKALYIYNKYKIPCFADDTGLEVLALGGAPGVFSARYAGENKTFNDNIEKLLQQLQNVKDRRARFRTVIALCLNNNIHLFEGVVNGIITSEKYGSSGFGYDPIFIPEGFTITFAQLTAAEKNIISHRYAAINKLLNSEIL